MSDAFRGLPLLVWFITGIALPLATQVPAALSPVAGLSNVVDLLDSYDRRNDSMVARWLEAETDPRVLDRVDADLSKRSKAWIEKGPPAERHRRALVAGALALEVTHVLVARESVMTGGRPDDHAQIPSALPAMTRLIADLMLSDPDDRDHVWALACLATWQEWDAPARNFATFEGDTRQPAWIILTGGPPMAPGLSAIQETVGTGGYVAQVLRRFPNDSHFLLAQAEGHEAVQTLCADQFCFDEITPAVLADLRQRAKSGPPDRPGFEYTFLRRIHDTAIVNLAGFDRLVPVAAEFAALAAAHPEVRSEANVHIGYLAIRAARPDAALAPLAIAATSDDPYVHYLAEQFTGLALETLGRAEDAIAAYRRALAIVPNAPSAATLLAAQLFVSDGVAEREEAFALLQAANSASPAPVDPRDLYWQGDARLWSVYMQGLREVLRQ